MSPLFNSLSDLAQQLATPTGLTRTVGIILLPPVVLSTPWLAMSGDFGTIIGIGLLGTTTAAITTGKPKFLYPIGSMLIGVGLYTLYQHQTWR